jgi:tRNA A37 threonylcarbamoyltransferase TsaD
MKKAVLSFRTDQYKKSHSGPKGIIGSGIQTLKQVQGDYFFVPPLSLTGDNAAMIGLAAAYQLANGIKPTTFDSINANSNLKL